MSNCMSSQHLLSCVCDVSPSPSKKRMSHMSDLYTTLQHFVGRPLPFYTTLLGSAVGNGPALDFVEAVPD